MNGSRHRRRPGRRWALTLALAATGLTGLAVAEDIPVRVKSLQVRSGKGSMYPLVAELKAGEKLQVTERQSGGWLKVKVGDEEGYVRETALASRGGSGLGDLSKGASALSGNAEASDVGASAAARGIEPLAQQYAASNGMSTAGVEQMIANRNRVIDSGQWVKFTEEGKVGPSRPQGVASARARGGAQ